MQFLILLLLLGMHQCGFGMNQLNSQEQKNTSFSKSLTVEQQELNTSFIISAKAGDLVRVKDLFKQGAQINALSKQVPTCRLMAISALFIAAREGHLDIVKYLIEQGARVNVSLEDGSTPLHTAAFGGQREVVNFLLSAGASPNNNAESHILIADGFNHSEIDYNEHVDPVIFRRLLLYGGGIDETFTPSLDRAALEELQQITTIKRGNFRQLSLYGGSIHQMFESSLDRAIPEKLLQYIAIRDEQKVSVLLNAYPANEPKDIVKDADGVSAVAYAAGQHNESILNLLLGQPAYQYNTAGLQQALNVVTSRLHGMRGIDAYLPLCTQYETIFNRLNKELNTTNVVFLEQPAKFLVHRITYAN
jgi:ankyrin repeat protein